MTHAKKVKHPFLSTVVDVLAVLATPVVEWLDDLTAWERVHRLVAALIVVGCAVAVLAACKPAVDVPGTPVDIVPATTVSVPSGWVTTVQPSGAVIRG